MITSKLLYRNSFDANFQIKKFGVITYCKKRYARLSYWTGKKNKRNSKKK